MTTYHPESNTAKPPRTNKDMDNEAHPPTEQVAENNTATVLQPQSESSRPRKKVNRGRYVLRACMHCQRRKIKCEGGTPCSQCIARKRDCISGTRAPPPLPRGRELTAEESVASVFRNQSKPSVGLKRVSSTELLRRIVSIENQISTALRRPTMLDVSQEDLQSDDSAMLSPKSPFSEVSDPSDNHQQVFFAEPCIDQAIKEAGAEGGNIEPTADQREEIDGKGGSLTPKRRSRLLEASLERQSECWLKILLASHNITPDETNWHDLLSTYFSEIHPLYPFLHPPSIWAMFEWVWQKALLLPVNEVSEEKRMSLAIIFLCLASGRCTSPSSTCNSPGGGRHSAGWGFYSVANHLLRDMLDLSRSSRPATLIEVQALLQIAMYLFRLDAMEKAELILAQAVSRSHVLALHRQHVDDQLPLFESEMRRRTWWCLFVMDRRLTLETGRPNLIQWYNVNLKNARSLSDEFLESYRQSNSTASSLEEEIRLEIARQPVTAIGYLYAISSFARISGEISKVLQVPQFVSESTLEVLDTYVELNAEKTKEELPSYLVHNPEQSFAEQYDGREWWQIKLSVLLYTRYLFLRIFLRNHSFRTTSHGDPMGATCLASSVLCGQLACNVVTLYDQIPNSYPKFVFPFTHFITSASMILLGLATKYSILKEHYRHAITSAVDTLYIYCHTTWVSTKSARTVRQLSKIAKGLYSAGAPQNPDSTADGLRNAADSHGRGSMERINEAGVRGLSPEQRSHQPPVAGIPVHEGSDDNTSTLGQGMLNAFSYLDATNDVIARIPAGSNQHKQQLSSHHELPHLWLANLSDGSYPHIPDWMTSNFDFEDSHSTSAPSNTGLSQAFDPGPGMSTFLNNVQPTWELDGPT